MSLKVSITSKVYELVSEGLHPAVLADVVDSGIVDVTFQGITSKKHQGRFVFFVDERDTEGKQKRIFQRFTVSLHAKATLTKLLGQMGITVDPNNKDVDLDALVLGKQVQVLIAHKDGEGAHKGKKFANITAFTKPQVGQNVTAPEDFKRDKDRDKTAKAFKKEVKALRARKAAKALRSRKA